VAVAGATAMAVALAGAMAMAGAMALAVAMALAMAMAVVMAGAKQLRSKRNDLDDTWFHFSGAVHALPTSGTALRLLSLPAG